MNRSNYKLILSVATFMVVLLGAFIAYNQYSLNRMKADFEARPQWNLSVDNKNQTLKLSTPTENIQFEKANVKFAPWLKDYGTGKLELAFSYGGEYYVSPPSNEMDLRFLSSGLELLCRSNSPKCVSGSGLSYPQIYPESKTALEKGVPTLVKIKYSQRAESREMSLLYLLPFHNMPKENKDTPAFFFEQPQLQMRFDNSSDAEAALDNSMNMTQK